MIKLLLENNVKIKFLNASYSVSVDIPFTSDFLEKENDIKHYCKAFGLMLSETSVIDINVKPLVCDIDYFNTICDENLNMYKDDNFIKLYLILLLIKKLNLIFILVMLFTPILKLLF